MKNREELLKGGMNSLFMKLAIPSILTGIIVGLYNLVDAIFVGQLIGPEAVGAVSLSYALTLANWAITFLVGVGSMSLLSRAIGAKDMDTVRKIPGNLLMVCATVSALLTLVTFVFAEPLIGFVGGTGPILDLGTSYIRIVCLGYVFASTSLGLNLLLRGEGKMKEAMLIVGMSNGLNILLDYIMIGPMGMGVEGAALATVVSQSVFLLSMLLYYRYGSSIISVGRPHLARDLIPKIGKVGSAAMMMMVLMAVQQVFLFRVIGSMGDESQLIVLSATLRLFTFLPIIAKGVGEGMQPLVGTAFGYGDLPRTRSAFSRFSILGTLLVLIPWMLIMTFPRDILGAFITDPVMLEAGYENFRLFFSSFILQVVVFNLNYYFIAIGKGKESGMLVLVRQLILFVPLVLVLPMIMGVEGAYLVIPLCDVLTVVIGALMMIREYGSQHSVAETVTGA